MPGKRLDSQAQDFVLKLISYFEEEKRNGGPLISVNSVHQRVSDALKISQATVFTIKQRKAQDPILRSPGKTRPRRKLKTTDLSNTLKMEVRNTMYDMYKQRQHVTLNSLKQALEAKEVLQIGTTSLGMVLKDIGFKYKKDDNRRALTEKLSIACKRTVFLRQYLENTKSAMPRQIIFLDETWIFSKGSKRKSWQDNKVESVRKENYDGKRFIVVHAGGSNGFVEGASLLFSSKTNTADYHGEMNGTLFKQWITDKLIPNLEEPSIIIMDNAPYHSMVVNKPPNSSDSKSVVVEWLQNNGIAHTNFMTKVELLKLVKDNKQKQVYIIDELLREHGHEILRLPPYHCEFNAIELVWAKTKGYYNTHIGRDGYGDQKVLEMWSESLEMCGEAVWKECVKHTEKIIKQWYDREQILVDLEVAPLVIAITNDSSSDTDSEND